MMQGLIVSMMRFSTAATLYSLEQLESSLELIQGDKDLSTVLDKIESAMDSMSDVLVDKLGKSNKDNLKSITDMTKDVVKRSFDGMSFMDPRDVMRNTTDFIRQSSDAMADWVGKVASTKDTEPKPAADVL